MKRQYIDETFRCESQSGMGLLETMIALAILLVAMIGIMGMVSLAVTTTENQGHLMARCTEYSQDKLEQLNSLGYGDSQTDTTVFPAVNTGGTGLTIGGSSDPTAPTASYVDYLDVNGNLTTTNQWYYIRVWKIEAPAGTTNLKKITVTAKVGPSAAIGRSSTPLQSTVVALKTSPF